MSLCQGSAAEQKTPEICVSQAYLEGPIWIDHPPKSDVTSGLNCAAQLLSQSEKMAFRLGKIHPSSRASFIAFLSGQETEKEALQKIFFSFWSHRSPKSRASYSGLQSSNWFFECEHQLLRETDGRNWAHWMQEKHGGERRSCENAWCSSTYTQASVSFY